jgi:hypothetical protein
LTYRGQVAFVEEALHALPPHLCGVDVAFAMDGNVMEVLELTRTASDAPEAADAGTRNPKALRRFPA